MPKTKSTNKKRSEAMKKRWTEKKAVADIHKLEQQNSAGMSAVEQSSVPQQQVWIKKSNYFNIRIERPDGTVISLTND